MRVSEQQQPGRQPARAGNLLLKWLSSITLAALLAGCGGGGGGAGSTGTTPQPVPYDPTQTGQGTASYEASELQLINNYRQQNGLVQLSTDYHLYQLALAHSQDMSNRGSMDHNGFDQRFQQAQQYGYTHCVENVAWNWATPQDLFNAWKNSPEHNANMLDAAIRDAGISLVNGYVTFFACN